MCFLRSIATKLHFDPEQIRLRIIAPDEDEPQRRIIHHPWIHKYHYRVSAGRMLLIDRKGKKEETFTLGGDLQIQEETDLTICTMVSAAPILHLIRFDSIPTLLAQEIEILLAARKAEWPPNDNSFEKRLAAADPLTLYAVCLKTLEDKFADPNLNEVSYTLLFYNFIQAEIRALHATHLWPSTLPDDQRQLEFPPDDN
jgi:hypothetical protein